MAENELEPWATSNEYNNRVQRLYKQSLAMRLFPTHCRRLAEFLRNAPSPSQGESGQFAWLYELTGDLMPVARSFDPSNISTTTIHSNNHIVFLAGYPSKHKLLQLGNLFDINPAFLDAHLSFIGDDVTSCEIHPSYYTLPSQQQIIFQTSVPCIGGAPEDPNYVRLSDKRTDWAAEVDRYLSNLKMGQGWNAFKSIVRNVEVHDSRRFSIHQKVTVLIKQSTISNKWLVVIWSDAGEDLTTSPRGPWIDHVHGIANTHFRPVILPRSSDFTPLEINSPRLSHPPFPTTRLHQTITLLPNAYGTSIDPLLSFRDPFYALSELFAFIAVAITQYLDVIRSVLDRDLSIDSQEYPIDRSEIRAMLENSYNGLNKQRDQITGTLTFFTCQLDRIGVTDSPSILLIVRDYEYLLERNNELLGRCDHEWNVIMSEAAVEDTQWGRDQSKSQHKFVLLATVYVPLSFSCSVFGMTFFELDSLQSGFRWWITVSAPLFVISFLFLFWDWNYITRKSRQLIRLIF